MSREQNSAPWQPEAANCKSHYGLHFDDQHVDVVTCDDIQIGADRMAATDECGCSVP